MSLTDLPQELLLAIIEKLDDIFALRALALSCHNIRNTTTKHERNLCQRILANLVGGLELKDVFLAWQARQELSAIPTRSGWTAEAQEQFMKRFEGVDVEQCVPDLTMAKALGIAGLYDAVNYFASDCAEEGLRIGHQRYSLQMSQEPRPSRLETLCVQRAFCRLELYTCLFTRSDAPSTGEIADEQKLSIFWDKYAPWENEQVACVLHYFYRRLTDILGKQATLDVDWTVYLSMLGGVNEAVVQLRLADGLKELRQFVTDTTDTRRDRLANRTPHRPVDPSYISDGLHTAVDTSSDVRLSDMTQDEQREVIKPAHLDDGDSGPEAVWRWAHQNESPADAPDHGFVCSSRQMSLRECGYVFWDRARIDRWGLLRTRWEGEYDTADNCMEQEEESRDRIQALAESLAEQGKTKTRWVV